MFKSQEKVKFLLKALRAYISDDLPERELDIAQDILTDLNAAIDSWTLSDGHQSTDSNAKDLWD